MAVLSAAQRKVIPQGEFCIPEKAPGPGSYPIPDRAHARAALQMCSGKPEAARVQAKVYARYPELRSV